MWCGAGKRGFRPCAPGGREPGNIDVDKIQDVRLDGFDLGRQCHLGRLEWDASGPRLFDRGGEAMVQLVAYDADAVHEVIVYEIVWP